MPQISSFYGIVITMYWEDHQPPHFHASYAGRMAAFGIPNVEVVSGQLPRRATRLVRRWAAIHEAELLEDWRRANERIPLVPIDPLP